MTLGVIENYKFTCLRGAEETSPPTADKMLPYSTVPKGRAVIVISCTACLRAMPPCFIVAYGCLWHLWFREIGADSRISMIRIGIVACDIVAITSHKHVECKTRKHTHELWDLRSLHSKLHIPKLKAVCHNVSLPTFLSVSSAPSVSVKWSWSIQNPRRVLVSWVRWKKEKKRGWKKEPVRLKKKNGPSKEAITYNQNQTHVKFHHHPWPPWCSTDGSWH